MATALVNQTEMLFAAVSAGSVEALQKLLKKTKHQERAKIADAFNSSKETPLLVAIKRNDQEMVRFLIEELNADISKAGSFNWKGVNYTEALPLFAAILSDSTSNVYIVNFLAAQDTTYDINVCDLSNVIQLTQKIDMLELMGAVYMLNPDSETTIVDQCQFDFPKLDPKCVARIATECWFLALQLRDELTGKLSDSSFMKTPSSLSKFAQIVFGTVAEFRTQHELEQMFAQKSRSLLESQALLVLQRILTRIDPDPHFFYIRRLLQFGKDWFSESANEYNRVVNVVLLALEPFHARQWEDVVNSDLFLKLVLGAVDMIKYFRWMKKEPPPNSSKLPYESLLEVITYVSSLLMKLQKPGDGEAREKAKFFVLFISDAIGMFTSHGKETTPEFKKWLLGYIEFTNSHPGIFTALHATCGFPNMPIKTVQLFLEGGSHPNAEDEKGATALHYLTRNKNSPNFKAAVNLLLRAGAFIDERFMKLKNQK